MCSMAPRLSSFHEVSSRIPPSKVMELAQASFERPPDSWTVGEPRFLSKGLIFRDVTFWTNGEATRRLSMKQDFHFRQEVKCKVLGLPGSQFPEAKIGQSWKMSRISSKSTIDLFLVVCGWWIQVELQDKSAGNVWKSILHAFDLWWRLSLCDCPLFFKRLRDDPMSGFWGIRVLFVCSYVRKIGLQVSFLPLPFLKEPWRAGASKSDSLWSQLKRCKLALPLTLFHWQHPLQQNLQHTNHLF